MIVTTYFCRKDRDQALRLMQWISELGGCKGHTLLLSYSRDIDTAGLQSDVVEEAQKHFDEVKTFVPDEDDERGWPMSANTAWRAIVYYVRQVYAKPWLWLEPDCVPLCAGWLDKIAAEYEEAMKLNKHFMGDEVTWPSHRLSGVAVYPARVVAFLTSHLLPELNREAWDSFFAQDFTRHSHFTKLIQHVWLARKNPDELMSFPDQASLAQLRPEAVLFHRSKAGDLIERLREKRSNFINQYSNELSNHLNRQLNESRQKVQENATALVTETFAQTETANAEFVRSSRAVALFGDGHNGDTAKSIVSKLSEYSKRDGFAKGRIIKELRAAGFITDQPVTMKKPKKRRRVKAQA